MSRDSLQTGLDLLRLNTTASMEPPGDIKAQIQASMVDVYCVNVHFLFLQLCQAKMERVRALQQQLHSESTRPMPENVETAAPGVVNCLVHVHGTQILFTKHFRTQVLF